MYFVYIKEQPNSMVLRVGCAGYGFGGSSQITSPAPLADGAAARFGIHVLCRSFRLMVVECYS